MKTLSMLAALLLLPGLALAVPPAHVFLSAPANLTCGVVDGNVVASWDAVVGATKYSVDVDTTYDVSGDGVVDATGEFDFSSVATFVSIPLTDLALSVDTDADGIPETFSPVSVTLKVKGLNPGKGHGRQNNPFSAVCGAL